MKKIIMAILILTNDEVFGQQMTQTQIDSIIKISNASESIAPTFMGTKSVLVVFKYSKKSVNKDLEKNLENEYKGEYKLLEADEVLNPKDTGKVRFFVMVFDRFSTGYASDIGRVKSETEYQITMTDRVTGKLYYYKEKSSCYTCIFKDYFRKLENLRAKL